MTTLEDELENRNRLYRDAVNALNQQLACDDPEQFAGDLSHFRENVMNRQRVYLEALERAYAHEIALKQAHGDGWRARIGVGYVFPWSSLKQHDRWNEAANRNPHEWNTDLYEEWQRGFMDNDRHRLFTVLTTLIGRPQDTHRKGRQPCRPLRN